MQKAENLGCTEYREPCPEAARCPTKGWKWEPVAPGPTRDGNGTLHFADFPEFKPNKTPMEMLQEGCFGGGYDFWPFRSRKLRGTEDTGWCELPQAWIEGLDPDIHLNGSKNGCYNKAVNKFQVSVDSSVDEWLAAGWFQWYYRFFQGRRVECDLKQIRKWTVRVGRGGFWRSLLLQECTRLDKI